MSYEFGKRSFKNTTTQAEPTPNWAIDLDGLEEYLVTYIYNQRQLTGLSITLEDPNANYVISRNHRDVNDRSPELKRGFIPYTSRDKAYEDGFFQFLRDRGTLQQMLNQTISGGPYNINVPFGIPPSQTSTPAIPATTPNPLEIDPPPFEFTPIPVRPPTPPGPRLIEDRASVIRFGEWSTSPLNGSAAIAEINELVGRLQRDPSLTINIEANIGGGGVSTDPGRLEAERRTFGLSTEELATGRRDRVLREFRRRARSAGVDENRIQGTVGSSRERSVRIQIFERE